MVSYTSPPNTPKGPPYLLAVAALVGRRRAGSACKVLRGPSFSGVDPARPRAAQGERCYAGIYIYIYMCGGRARTAADLSAGSLGKSAAADVPGGTSFPVLKLVAEPGRGSRPWA